MQYVVPVPSTPALPVHGSDFWFPIHRVYCVGRNYIEHAREMQADEREPPFFFLKPADAVVADGCTIPYPPATTNLHHEIELVVALERGGVDIPVSRAIDCVFGYAVGVDLTRRDLQLAARDRGRPWDMGKSFEQAGPCSAIRSAGVIGHPNSGRIRLEVNGKTRQDSDIDKLIWSVPELIANLSTLITLAPGDLIFTGTPAGVGPLSPGDHITGSVEGVAGFSVIIEAIADEQKGTPDD